MNRRLIKKEAIWPGKINDEKGIKNKNNDLMLQRALVDYTYDNQ